MCIMHAKWTRANFDRCPHHRQRYALVVNMKSGGKGDEQPSDVRLALELLRVLDLTDAGTSIVHVNELTGTYRTLNVSVE